MTELAFWQVVDVGSGTGYVHLKMSTASGALVWENLSILIEKLALNSADVYRGHVSLLAAFTEFQFVVCMFVLKAQQSDAKLQDRSSQHKQLA